MNHVFKRKTNAILPVCSFIFGLAGFLFMGTPQIIISAIAVILGVTALLLKFAKGGFAIAGIVLGLLHIFVLNVFYPHSAIPADIAAKIERRGVEFNQELTDKINEGTLSSAYEYFYDANLAVLSDPGVSPREKLAKAIGIVWGNEYYYSQAMPAACKKYGVDFAPFVREYRTINAKIEAKASHQARSLGFTESSRKAAFDINRDLAVQMAEKEIDEAIKETELNGNALCEAMIWSIQNDKEYRSAFDFSLSAPIVYDIIEKTVVK